MNLFVPKNMRFECQRCARCCGDTSHRGRNLLLTKSEVDEISSKYGMSPLSFALPIPSKGQYQYKMKKRSGKCVFLEGKACRIYELRPIICRFFPFSMCKKDNKYVFDVVDDCPGIGLGEVLPCEKFEDMVDEAHLRLKAI